MCAVGCVLCDACSALWCSLSYVLLVPTPRPEDARAHLHAVIRAALDAADPHAATLGALRSLGHIPSGPVLAIGKAARAMLAACDDVLREPCCALAVSTEPGERATDDGDPRVIIGDHPLPGARSGAAGERARDFLAGAARDGAGHLTLLVSGGASALCAWPLPPLTVDDLRTLTDALMRAGATIQELNTVRRHTEDLKGGRLGARWGGLVGTREAPAVTCLVLSDVVAGEGQPPPLHDIGSGPAAHDPTTCDDAREVLMDTGALIDHPDLAERVARALRAPEAESVKPGAPSDPLAHVRTHVVADRTAAQRAAIRALRLLGYDPVITITEPIIGDARRAGDKLVTTIREDMAAWRTPFAIVGTGETTVRVQNARGHGGRNQEVALAAALGLAGSTRPVTVLALATDGVDGVAPPGKPAAAGAIVDHTTATAAHSAGVYLRTALDQHNAYGALERLGAHVITGPTGTNVNDLTVAVVG